ncbi:hypothetical protein CPB84DRAFT_1842352 [Gymnopilus junonius]|uniref:Uncharacterized protein n=1 Tax=Gymnopilus junonius TaxID=109634 RepID=A0A9P5NW22_GYMJU|nr:hypothetical protein CPB84DRAFT_1842352 [Gymnopilus junonius]
MSIQALLRPSVYVGSTDATASMPSIQLGSTSEKPQDPHWGSSQPILRGSSGSRLDHLPQRSSLRVQTDSSLNASSLPLSFTCHSLAYQTIPPTSPMFTAPSISSPEKHAPKWKTQKKVVISLDQANKRHCLERDFQSLLAGCSKTANPVCEPPNDTHEGSTPEELTSSLVGIDDEWEDVQNDGDRIKLGKTRHTTPNQAAAALYMKWQALLPTLLEPLLRYMSDMMGKPLQPLPRSMKGSPQPSLSNPTVWSLHHSPQLQPAPPPAVAYPLQPTTHLSLPAKTSCPAACPPMQPDPQNSPKGAIQLNECSQMLCQLCPACFGGQRFRQSLQDGGDFQVVTDGNFHHHHLVSGSESIAFHDPKHIIPKAFVDEVGAAILSARKLGPKSRSPKVPDLAIDECEKSYEATNGEKKKSLSNDR